MASTIQLRTGTGSAVPSALTQGEVAINVTNGLVYYGSGSGNDVKQLESFTHVTASGNISSSGDITANSFVGNLTGQAATVATIAGLAPNTATTQATQPNITAVGTLGALTVSGDITANGNIVGDDSTNITNINDIQCDSITHDGDTDTRIIFGNDAIRFTVGNAVNTDMFPTFTFFQFPVTASAGIHAAAIVSASGFETPLGTVTAFSGAFGDVSASGTILAAKLDAAAVSDTLAAAIVAEIDNDEIPIAKLAEDAVTVTAGTNLSNGGTVTLGGSITLNVDDAFLKNDADDTTSGTITSAGLIATKATDGGDTIIQIINSNTDGGVDKGAGIEFLHGSAVGALSGNQKAGKILSTKASGYQGATSTIDSNLEFYTANNNTDTLQLKIDNTGLAAFIGDVSSSGKFIASEISASTAVNGLTITGNITASGNISASGRIYGRQFEQIETNFAENFGSRGVVYMPFSNQSISDNTNSSNINVNRVAAVPGKPVKSVIRAISNTLGNNAQYTMSYWEAAAGDPTNPILKSAAYAITDASSNKDAITFDFTDPGSGSTTDVAVGSRIWMTLEAEGTGNGSFIVTHLWEWDYNSI